MNWPVLIYDLPFAGVAGDVLMRDPLESGSPILDVLRFDGAGHLTFYSDSIDGYDAPADTPGPPNQFINFVFINEQGAEGQVQDGFWLPTPEQAGYDASNPVYRFISDVPEPGAVTLLLAGAGILLLVLARRKSRVVR